MWYAAKMTDEKRPPGRPTTGVTPKRNIRVGADWDRLDAETGGESMTDVIKRLIAAELRRIDRKKAAV